MRFTERLAAFGRQAAARLGALALICGLAGGGLPALAADAGAAAHAATNAEKTAKGVAKGAVAKHHIVVQVTADDSKTWNSILGNLHNIQDELRGDGGVEIRVVAISGGLGMLTAESLAANRVQDAMTDGVQFVACGNSMQAQQIQKEDLIAGVSVVKAGYVEVHRLQQKGWTYLRP